MIFILLAFVIGIFQVVWAINRHNEADSSRVWKLLEIYLCGSAVFYFLIIPVIVVAAATSIVAIVEVYFQYYPGILFFFNLYIMILDAKYRIKAEKLAALQDADRLQKEFDDLHG